MTGLIASSALQIVAVCDPNKFTTDYVDWSLNDVRNLIRRALQDNSWGEKLKGIPGGRDIGQEFVNKYYAKSKELTGYKGCASYIDFRELLEKETGIDAIKIMTPDHLHATVAIASMKKANMWSLTSRLRTGCGGRLTMRQPKDRTKHSSSCMEPPSGL